MLATPIYVLCALTSLICATLLLRGWSKSRARLLFWSGLCFAGLAINNVLLIVDITVLPQVDMEMWRTLPALAGISLLVYGLIWETPR